MRRGGPRYLVITVAFLGVGALASAFLAQGRTATPNGQHRANAQAHAANRAQFTNRLVGDLRRRGFQVNPGYAMVWARDTCQKYLYPAMESCLGNNPAGAYGIAVVKAWSNEHIGPSSPDAFGQVKRGYTPFYRLDPREAIVLSQTMPPPGKFAGWQSFVWTQPGHWTAKDYNSWARTPNRPYPMQYLFATVPPSDPHARRTQSWSSFGDSVNNVVMQRQSGAPWGKNRYLIITPSATTEHAVRRALQAQRVPNRDIFTERIPSRDDLGPIGPLGMARNALDFYTFFRYAIPTDQTAAQKWWADLPVTVLRVRAPSSLGPVRRYGLATYGKRTARSEAYLAGDLQHLVTGVCTVVSGIAHLQSADCTQPPPASSFIPDPARDYGWRAPYCRKVHMWCGDISDAALFWTGPLPLDSGQVYAVVDTLATRTGNATYVGLGVNDASTFLAPPSAGVTDTTLKGSAQGYGALVTHPDKFFVHYFTRNCGVLEPLLGKGRLSQDCTELSTDSVPPSGIPGHPALRGMFWPGLRDYIEPGSAHGPDTSKLLRPRILAFTRQ